MLLKTYVTVAVSVLVIAGIASYGLTRRPSLMPVDVTLPSADQTIKIYDGYSAIQTATIPSTSFSGILLYTESLPENGHIILQVKEAPQEPTLRSVRVRLAEAESTRAVRFHGAETVLNEEVRGLYLPFERIDLAPDTKVSLHISTEGVTKQRPLSLRYEPDSSKYTDGHLQLQGKTREGDLGMILYDRPTLLERLRRWSHKPDNALFEVGLMATVTGLIVTAGSRPRRLSQHWKKLPPFFPFTVPSRRELLLALVLSILLVFAVYGEALRLTVHQDDIDIFLRAKQMQDQPLQMIFTNRRDFQVSSYNLAVGFYRPISYSLYPLVMYSVFGLSMIAHYALHLGLLGLLTYAVYIVARSFLPLTLASLVAVVWIVHPTKAGIAYWLSSSQDILASLAFLGAFITYLYCRRRYSLKRYLLFLSLFTLGIFSKDFVILLPLLLVTMEGLLAAYYHKQKLRHYVPTMVYILAPLVIIVGFFIMARTAAMGDPTLPPAGAKDSSYDLTVKPQVLAANVLAYASWSSASTVWADTDIPFLITKTMREMDFEGVWYAGYIAVLGYALMIGLFWKRRHIRILLLFGVAWWGILLLPNLLLINERTERWLTMPLLGPLLGLAAGIQMLTHKSRYVAPLTWVLLLLTLAAGISGFITNDTYRLHQSLSDDVSTAVTQYAQQAARGDVSEVIFVNVPPEVQGSVNQRLLLLFFDNVPPKLRHLDTKASQGSPAAAIISLTEKYGGSK